MALAAATAGLMLAGCGTAICACGAAPQTPPAVTSPEAGFDVLVTETDQDITVHVGQKIEVYLRPRAGLTPWSYPRSSDEAVVAPMQAYPHASFGATAAGFKAISPGTSSITAYATAGCSPGQACPMFAALLSVRVTVV